MDYLDYEDYSDISFKINNTKLFINTYLIYLFIFMASYTNYTFSVYITPSNFIKGYYYSHKLVAYSMSTIHGFIAGTYGLSYVLGLISMDGLYSGYYFSLAYFLGDITYIILSSKSIEDFKKNILIIIHHLALMTCFIVSLCGNNETHTFHLAMGLIAEYAVIPLNICWYIKNTNQNYNVDKDFIMSSIVLIITYFITRVINLSFITVSYYLEGMYIYLIIVTPITLLNYYWFYKLLIINNNMNNNMNNNIKK
jgi:hypothetical protein